MCHLKSHDRKFNLNLSIEENDCMRLYLPFEGPCAHSCAALYFREQCTLCDNQAIFIERIGEVFAASVIIYFSMCEISKISLVVFL